MRVIFLPRKILDRASDMAGTVVRRTVASETGMYLKAMRKVSSRIPEKTPKSRGSNQRRRSFRKPDGRTFSL